MLATPPRPPRASLARVVVAALAAAAMGTLAPAGAGAQGTSDSLVTLAEGCTAGGGVGRSASQGNSPARRPRAPGEGARDAPAVAPAGTLRPDSAAHPALVLRAAVSAREIRFTGQPRVVVRLCGAVGDSVRVVERRNLPSPVVVGTTYRDVYVAVEILGHLDAQCLAAQLTGARRDSSASDARCAFLTTRSSDR